MAELKRGSKLIRVESTFEECSSLQALKDENMKMKNKIVSLKEDFQRIINEVQTLQYYVVEHGNKTKDKFRKIKIIVSTLKKEREFLFAQNQNYCNELRSLLEENDSLRQLLGKDEMEKKARNEHFEKKETTKEESKQPTEEKKEEKKKEKTIEGVGIPHTLIMNNSLEKKNLLLGHHAITKEKPINEREVENVPMDKMEPIETENTNDIIPNKKWTSCKNHRCKNNRCKKTIRKKKRKSVKQVICIKEKKRVLWIISEYLQNGQTIENTLPRNTVQQEKNISKRNITKNDPFDLRKHSSPEKRNILLKKNSSDFGTIIPEMRRKSEMMEIGKLIEPESHLVGTDEMEEQIEENKKDRCVVVPLTEDETNVMNKDHREPLKMNVETIMMRTVVPTDGFGSAKEKETVQERDFFMTDDLHRKGEEWNEVHKETKYLIDGILRICGILGTEYFNRMQWEIKRSVSNVDIICKNEDQLPFARQENFLSEKHSSRNISLCMNFIEKQIAVQNEKINEFEMKINNINIFSHDLLNILKENFYRKIKKEKQHIDILTAVSNIINECKLKKESFS